MAAASSLLIAACSGSKELEKPKPSEISPMQEFEKDFRPSDYDMDVRVFLSETRKDDNVKVNPPDPAVVEPPVIVPGYRVQLFATSEIDAANAKKELAENAFPGQWFYLEYDPPTYKLRAGNFVNRNEADLYAKFLSENGFPDAWPVPERIVKNIQPRVAPPPTEQTPPKQ